MNFKKHFDKEISHGCFGQLTTELCYLLGYVLKMYKRYVKSEINLCTMFHLNTLPNAKSNKKW